jgi:hypothetical protein
MGIYTHGHSGTPIMYLFMCIIPRRGGIFAVEDVVGLRYGTALWWLHCFLCL